ncbi:MAG TPA: glycoside hydrolase family 2 protein, partial [Devosia sp.]|nr:glycoside hydrolase family 2 protein [Devosia sp.]
KTRAKVGPDAAKIVETIKLQTLQADEFLFFSWADSEGKLLGENDYFPKPYKAYELAAPTITTNWSTIAGKPALTLTADKPALFTTATVAAPGYFSDNAVTLLPGRPTILTFHPRHGATPSLESLAASLKLQDLSQTF